MTAPATTAEPPRLVHHGNAYNIFILVLTILSLVGDGPAAVAGHRPRRASPPTLRQRHLRHLPDRLHHQPQRREAQTGLPRKPRGWLDLLGSIPSVGVLPDGALFRLFRLSRLARIGRLIAVRGQGSRRGHGQEPQTVRDLHHDPVAPGWCSRRRACSCSSSSAGRRANITPGGDALWWAIVTITTVGYGDYYPDDHAGRSTAVVVMITVVGIIGALASILASILIRPAQGKGARGDRDRGRG